MRRKRKNDPVHVLAVRWLKGWSFILAGDVLFVPDLGNAKLNRLIAKAAIRRAASR
jgi:hypothetical protein